MAARKIEFKKFVPVRFSTARLSEIFLRIFSRSFKEIDRAPRVRLVDRHRICFYLDLQDEAWEVHNLSTTGLALSRPVGKNHLKRSFNNNEILKGHLAIGETLYPLHCEVRHQSESILGCRFEGASFELVRAIKQYLLVEIMGIRLRAIDPKVLNNDANQCCLWFVDDKQNEVFIELSGEVIVNFHLCFLGNYLEGGQRRKLRCGFVSEEPRRKINKDANVVHLLNEVPKEMPEVAAKLIENIKELDPKIKIEINRLLALKS